VTAPKRCSITPAGRSSSETHLLRLIDKYISFEFVRRQLKDSYSETGRPSIDPELRATWSTLTRLT
jgi:hypothetical protein